MSADGVRGLPGFIGLERDPHRTPLPSRRRTFRIGRSIATGFSQRLSSVQACGVPPGTRWRRVSCRHRRRRNRRRSRDTSWPLNSKDRIQAGRGTRHVPVMRSTSNHPPRCHTQCVAAAHRPAGYRLPESAPHHEQAFGDVMRGAQSRFAGPAVHVESAHFQVEALGFVGSGAPFDCGPLAKS